MFAFIAAVALLFVAPSIATAQTSPFFDLALRVNVGDRLEVKDPSGATTAGRLAGLTPTEITLQTASGERRFGVGVLSISVRHRSTRKAVLIGAGLGAAVGLVEQSALAPGSSTARFIQVGARCIQLAGHRSRPSRPERRGR
jgi:hypothetical protein